MITASHVALIAALSDLAMDIIDRISKVGDLSEDEAQAMMPDIKAKRDELRARQEKH